MKVDKHRLRAKRFKQTIPDSVTIMLRPVIKSVYNEITDYFMDFPYFDQVNPEEIKIIAKHMASKEIEEGETLFTRSEIGNYVCFIVSGTMIVLGGDESGEESVLATLTRGQSIGEMSVIEDLPRSATAKALERSQLYILSKSAFEHILSRHPHIGIKLLRNVSLNLSRNLRETSRQLVQYMNTSENIG